MPDATLKRRNRPGPESEPVTDTGLPVKKQIRKEWDPNKDGGVAIPLRSRGRMG